MDIMCPVIKFIIRLINSKGEWNFTRNNAEEKKSELIIIRLDDARRRAEINEWIDMRIVSISIFVNRMIR